VNDILAVDQLDVRHGLLQAVRGVSFAVATGEIVAFVGANGAGKTTLFRAIAGAHRPAGGRTFFQGNDITPMPDYERVRRGIVLVPEGRRLFTQLSVLENLTLAGAVRRPGRCSRCFRIWAAVSTARLEIFRAGSSRPPRSEEPS
jgi:branched-chain amino acid transport system ATP-binding protein